MTFMDQHDRCGTIKGFVALSERLGTAGQPTESQFADVAGAGYELVVNLGLPSSEGALPDEKAIVERHGLTYLHLPIDFQSPKVEIALRFFRVLDENRGRRLFVHCAANMRVSALVFAYRVARGDMSRDEAWTDLVRVWQPNPTWQKFIEEVIAAAIRTSSRPRR
jgi:protein tyrosine phosphatase (PTP) superfamily phosphohydrolase (DUF442 family)